MHAKYIAEGSVDAPILLLADVSPGDAGGLIAALGPLASGVRSTATLHQLSTWDSASRLALEALAGTHDSGCAPVGDSDTEFRCVFRPSTWDNIIGLLTPFVHREQRSAHGHQYLSEHGPVTWIASTDATW